MKKIARVTILFFGLTIPVFAQQIGGGGEANPDLKTNLRALQNWQAMRFGLFIHWGPVSLRGTEIGWSRGREVPIREYDNLYKEFNPLLFDAREWVTIAREAGMKYIIITSKHHDGFCLWDSKFTDYDIMSTPFKRDILKELSEACREQGILFGTYYSIADWHHPDYTTRYGGDPRPLEQSDMNRYVVYLKNQVKELIENYHTKILWFDGHWEKSWDHEKGMSLYKYIRDLKDDILINNRVDKGRTGSQGMTASQKFAGDFGTPEQRVGAFDIEHPWESCITICKQWAWKPNDRLKSLRECIQTLAKTAGGGGNLLLNVGPMLDGRIEQRQINRLREVGKWLQKNGESIYGTRGGPFKPTPWMVSTRKADKIFVHLFNWPKKELLLPELKGLNIQSARILEEQKLQVSRKGKQFAVQLPSAPPDSFDTVIQLTINGSAEKLEPVQMPENVLSGLAGARLKLSFEPSNRYPANGLATLTDRIRGSTSYTDGNWLGFEGVDFSVKIDLDTERELKKIAVGFLQNQNSWIFLPQSIELMQSEDGESFTRVDLKHFPASQKDDDIKTMTVTFDLPTLKTRHLMVRAENIKICPDWHKGAGGKAWLFVDEIIVE